MAPNQDLNLSGWILYTLNAHVYGWLHRQYFKVP